MQHDFIRMLVENQAEQLFIEGIFREEIESQEIRVETGWEAGTVIGIAQSSLLEQPQQVIAVVLNTNTVDPIEIEEEFRGPAKRILARANPVGWHIALAIPTLETWAIADPRIKEAFEEDELNVGPRTLHDTAVRFAEFTRHEPFNRDALYQANPEFRALSDFINRHLAGGKVVAGTGN